MNDLSAIPIPPDLADEFFRQQESLHAEHIRSIARGRRTAWRVAGCAVALAVLGCITHMRTATGTRFVIDGGYTL